MEMNEIERFLASALDESGQHPELEDVVQMDKDVFATADGYRMHMVLDDQASSQASTTMAPKLWDAFQKSTKGSPIASAFVNPQFLIEAVKDMDHCVGIELHEKTIVIRGLLKNREGTDACVVIMGMEGPDNFWKPQAPQLEPSIEFSAVAP